MIERNPYEFCCEYVGGANAMRISQSIATQIPEEYRSAARAYGVEKIGIQHEARWDDVAGKTFVDIKVRSPAIPTNSSRPTLTTPSGLTGPVPT